MLITQLKAKEAITSLTAGKKVFIINCHGCKMCIRDRVLKAVTEDEAGTMFFSLDNMKFNLLDDGKLCLIAEDDAEESDDGEEADDSETGEVDFSVKTYFEKIIVTE